MAVSDKSIFLDLLVFPRNILKFGFNVVTGATSIWILNVVSRLYSIWLVLYGNQSIDFCSDKYMIHNVNTEMTNFRIMLLLFLFSNFQYSLVKALENEVKCVWDLQ